MLKFNPNNLYALNFFVSGLPYPVVVATATEAEDSLLRGKDAPITSDLKSLVSWCRTNGLKYQELKRFR